MEWEVRTIRKCGENDGEITAWNQLRSSGRQGSAIADELIYWAENSSQWHGILMNYAQTYFAKVEADYQEFSSAIAQRNLSV